MVDITEILIHWHAGRSIGEVARSLGVDRNTVRKYIRPAVEAGMTPGGEPVSLPRWGELVREWFPELVTTELRHPKFAEIAPYHELIGEMLKTNTVTTVHQRLRDERGLQVSIASFRRYVWRRCLRSSRCAARCRCASPIRRQARKPRSTTATWASGPTRPPVASGGCGRS